MIGSTQDELFFRDIVHSYIDAPRFLRRDWLAAELQQRLEEPNCRFALLTAEAGAGKSAFLAQLANDHPDWLCYFIRRDQRTSMGESSGRSFLLRIGFELAAIRPNLFDLEQIRIEVQQRIGVANENVIGATIERIRASPFHQTVVQITQDIRRGQGSVTGLRIGEWIADPRLIEIDDLQQMALFAPARSLLRISPDARIVILVDALDELRFGEASGNLLEWLTNCPPLPENVRIVLTSRPSSQQLDVFIEKRKDSLALLALEASDHRMRDDIRTYAAALVEPAEISAALKETGRTRDAFITELTLRADGNIGYAAALGRAFDQALRNPEQRPLLIELLRLERLPDDTRQLFAFFLRLIETGPGAKSIKMTDPNTGKAAILEAWPELYQPILALLAVALEPLTLDQIHILSASLAERNQVGQAIGWLEQFLDKIGGRYRLYHATLASFLTAPETRADEKTSYLWIDAHKEHRRIASVLEGQTPETIWQDSSDPAEQGRRDYSRLHYIMHLYLGENWEKLAAVIETGEYGRGKLRFDRSTYLYSRDLDLAIRATTRKSLDEAARLAELPRLWSFKLLRSTLSSYADRLPGNAYQLLSLIGRDREAIDLAELITDPNRQSLAFIMIGFELGQRAEAATQAADLIQRASEIAGRVVETRSRSALLNTLIEASGPLAPASAAVRQAIVGLARTFSDAADRAGALADGALAFLKAGHIDEARALRSEIEALLSNPQVDEAAQSVLYSDSVLNVELGDFEAAYAATRKLSAAAALSVLAMLARRQQQSGTAESFEATRTEIECIRSSTPPGPPHIHASAVLAQVCLNAGDETRALPILADALDELRQNDITLIDISSALDIARVLRKANNAELFADAVRLVKDAAVAQVAESDDKPRQSFRLSLRAAEAARGLADLDECEEALEITRRLNYYEQGTLLLSVVRSLVGRGEFNQALVIADEIQRTVRQGPLRFSIGGGDSVEPYSDSVVAFLIISTGLAEGGQWQQALDVAGRISEVEARIDALSRVAILQFEAGGPAEATQILDGIMRDVRLGNTVYGQDAALRQVAELLVLARQWQQAREIARSIATPYERADAQTGIERALIDAGEFDAAQQMLLEISSQSARAESLLALIRKLYSVGGTPGRPIDNPSIIGMLGAARGYAEADTEKGRSAAVLRSIALAYADLLTGDAEGASSTMRVSITALNAAGGFQFVPTPWCDTAVAFAKLSDWDSAMNLAKWQVETNPLDGCCSLRDLAHFAATSGDIERAKALLAQARESVQRIPIPPQRSDVLATIAPDYARIGMLEEAMDVARASGSVEDAQAKIAVALLESGKVEEALHIIDAIKGAGPRNPFSLVNALLNAAEFTRAQAVASSLADAAQRSELLVHVARRQIAAGKQTEARAIIASVMEVVAGLSDARSARRVFETLPFAFAELGDFIAVRRFVEERWVAASTRADLLALMGLARPLVSLQPDLPQRIRASFGWVEQTLLAV
jgi:tetratricopeptide (TPR) repeat protein